jgi:hypothetical protein
VGSELVGSVGAGGSSVEVSSVVVSSVVTGSDSVEVDAVSSVDVLPLAASIAVPSSADAANAPPSAAPSANTTVATKRRPTDRARIDPFSCSRRRGEGWGWGAARSSAEGWAALDGRRSAARRRKAYPRQSAAFCHEKAL